MYVSDFNIPFVWNVFLFLGAVTTAMKMTATTSMNYCGCTKNKERTKTNSRIGFARETFTAHRKNDQNRETSSRCWIEQTTMDRRNERKKKMNKPENGWEKLKHIQSEDETITRKKKHMDEGKVEGVRFFALFFISTGFRICAKKCTLQTARFVWFIFWCFYVSLAFSSSFFSTLTHAHHFIFVAVCLAHLQRVCAMRFATTLALYHERVRFASLQNQTRISCSFHQFQFFPLRIFCSFSLFSLTSKILFLSKFSLSKRCQTSTEYDACRDSVFSIKIQCKLFVDRRNASARCLRFV